MKIMLISSVALKTPPKSYGGLERVWYEHARGLSELGHDVTLVASKESSAPQGVKLIETVPSWDSLNPAQQKMYAKADRVWNGWRAQEEEAYKMYESWIKDYDVIADASWSKWSYMSKKDEIVGTCHSIRPYNVKPPREFANLTGVSKGHSRHLSRELHIPVRTIWNSFNVEEFELETVKSERVLSLNRVMVQKGIHLFLDVVRDLDLPADIAGDDSTLVQDQNYVQMVKERVKQMPKAKYYGLVDDATRIKLLRDAKVLVCLKDAGYEEIFGLSAVEAMACGTPVVAAKSWGFEDIIEPGKSGFLCQDMDQVKDAVSKIMDGRVVLKAEDCRASVEKFARENCVKQLSNVLECVKNGSRW